MADFINTIDVLGDEAVIDGIIGGTIAEFRDNKLESVHNGSFKNCTNLKVVELPEVKGSPSFAECSNLETVELPKATGLPEYAFSGTKVLELKLPSLVNAGCFRDASSLVLLDLPVLTSIPSYGIYGCTSLKYLILRNRYVCTLGSFGLGHNGVATNHKAKIFVPAALVEAYKAATNWSEQAAKIYALEDYTVDGTITGELDTSKI